MTRRVVVYTDGGARGNPGPAAIGAVVIDPAKDPPETLASVSEAIGVATNNEAEYRAVIAGLESALEMGAREVELRADSELVIRQLEGRYKVKTETLRPFHQAAQTLLTRFDRVRLTHVRREKNTEADALVNQALDEEAASRDAETDDAEAGEPS